MKSTAIGAGALATALLTATVLISDVAQEKATQSSPVVRRVEPFARLTATSVKPVAGAVGGGTAAFCPNGLQGWPVRLDKFLASSLQALERLLP